MNLPVSITKLCSKTGMSRQNFYKSRAAHQRRTADEDRIEELVQEQRALQPRLGGRKLYHLLSPDIAIGRDRFFTLLRDRDLLLEPLPKRPRTTNSRHSLPVFVNQLKDMELSGPCQAWVSDITYLDTSDGFVYLSLIMDAWSRKIMGWHVGGTLETEESLHALEKAVRELSEGLCPLHHSDRGSQYCSHRYVEKLREYGLGISMTEEQHCYENAKAERLNGILKQEYGLYGVFRNKAEAERAVNEAVKLYNSRRPHQALNYRTPDEVHRQTVKAA